MKFTFKTEKSTGQYSSFFKDDHYIKLKKVEVGNIVDQTWQIGFMVVKDDINEDGNPNCDWKWIHLKHKSISLQDAKDFLNRNIDRILKKYKLVNQ